jgi:hypothetical protein
VRQPAAAHPRRQRLPYGLGLGPRPTTFIATENFLADRIFAAWLEYYRPQAGNTLLILNGDIFDVLRITEVPVGKGLQDWSDRLYALGAGQSVDELKSAVLDHERDYGLQTDDYKTVWKLLLNARSHPVFFDALAEWLHREGRVLIIAGNHDVELHWQLVRDAIRFEVTKRGVPRDEAVERVAFADEHVVIDNLHVEHGHQYDEMTRVDYPLILRDEPSQINLPLGSFVNRYFINRIEALDPFIDNVKPVQDSLLRLARQRPLKSCEPTEGRGASWYARSPSGASTARWRRSRWRWPCPSCRPSCCWRSRPSATPYWVGCRSATSARRSWRSSAASR